jgi:hypothetical protein
LFYSYAVFAELEERRVGLILGYTPSSLEEFWLAPIHPPMVAFAGPSIDIRDGLVSSWLQQALWPEGDMEKGTVKLVVFNDDDFGY